MRIGFFAPCNVYNSRTGPLMGLGYMAAYLEEQLGLDDIFVEVDSQRLIQRQPDLVAISSFSEMYNVAIAAAKQFKHQLDVPIVIGGPHISALPTSLHPSMDVGVIGEGEMALKQLVEILLKGQLWEPHRLQGISNLIYWSDQGKTTQAICQERVQDLDQLPLPRRDIMHAHWPDLGEEVHWEQGVYTSRGCPFTCRFCMFSQRPNLVRYHSVEHVMRDLEDVICKYPRQENIIFYDDLFVTKKSRLKAIADGIRSEGFHKRVSFGCMAKTSFFDEEFCLILKSMNIRVISFGFESGADPILQYLKDRHSTVKKHQQAIELCYKHGIHVGGYFIMGSPPEQKKQLAQTYWFIRKNLPKMPLSSIFPVLPLPGTELWRETEERGLIDASFERWENFGYLQLDSTHYIHLNQHYSLEEMKETYDRWFEPLMQRTTRVFKEENNNLPVLQQYYQQIVADIRNQFPVGSCLLEVQRGERQIAFELEKDYHLTSIHWTDWPTLADDARYDAVILTHTLEKAGFNSPLWQRITDLNCPILAIVENVASLPRLFDLIKGVFSSDLDGLARYDQAYLYSLQSLEAQLKKRAYHYRHIQRYRLKGMAGESSQLKHMAHFLGQFFKVEAFLREADVYSYALYIEAIPCSQLNTGCVQSLEGGVHERPLLPS